MYVEFSARQSGKSLRLVEHVIELSKSTIGKTKIVVIPNMSMLHNFKILFSEKIHNNLNNFIKQNRIIFVSSNEFFQKPIPLNGIAAWFFDEFDMYSSNTIWECIDNRIFKDGYFYSTVSNRHHNHVFYDRLLKHNDTYNCYYY